MKNEIRILTHFSPFVEEDIVLNRAEGSLPLLNSLLCFIEKFKHTTLFIIPSELLCFFYSNTKLRIIIERIKSNTQINILIASIPKYESCGENGSLVYQGFPYSTNTHNFTNYISRENKAGFLFDKSSFSYKKQACTSCEVEFNCASQLLFTVFALTNYINLKRDFEEIAETTLETWTIKKSELDENDLKGLGFLQAVLHGAAEDEIKTFKGFSISSRLINDLRKLDGRSLADAAFCMFRACAYPSSQIPNHHRLSIDWHPNTPSSIIPYEYKLFRVDVLPANKTGIHTSGIIRLLMAQKGPKSHFIMVTEDHDFCTRTIRERVSQLP